MTFLARLHSKNELVVFLKIATAQKNGRCPLNISLRVFDISIGLFKFSKENSQMTEVNHKVQIINCKLLGTRREEYFSRKISNVLCI